MLLYCKQFSSSPKRHLEPVLQILSYFLAYFYMLHRWYESSVFQACSSSLSRLCCFPYKAKSALTWSCGGAFGLKFRLIVYPKHCQQAGPTYLHKVSTSHFEKSSYTTSMFENDLLAEKVSNSRTLGIRWRFPKSHFGSQKLLEDLLLEYLIFVCFQTFFIKKTHLLRSKCVFFRTSLLYTSSSFPKKGSTPVSAGFLGSS